jgi:hypothetical protein
VKLSEIKVALIDQFFSKHAAGVSNTEIDQVFEDLGKLLKRDLTDLTSDEIVTEAEGSSSDPSKAFKKFIDGKTALLSICEDDGFKKMVIFAAARSGKSVVYEDLTLEERSPKKGDLSTIKNALRQAKKLNDEIYYTIRTEG